MTSFNGITFLLFILFNPAFCQYFEQVCYRNFYFNRAHPAPEKCPPNDFFGYYECCDNVTDLCCRKPREIVLAVVIIALLIFICFCGCCVLGFLFKVPINRSKKGKEKEKKQRETIDHEKGVEVETVSQGIDPMYHETRI